MPKNKSWVIFFVIFEAVLWTVLIISRLFIAGINIDQDFVLASLMVSTGTSLIISLVGFLKLRRVFLFSIYGVVAGIILMVNAYIKGGGWEDITGFILYVQFAIIGFGAGVIAETILYIARKIRKDKK